VAVCQSLTSNSASTMSVTDQPMWGLWRRKSQRGAFRFWLYQSVRFHIVLWALDYYWQSVSDTCPGNGSAVPSIKYHEMLTLYSLVVTICTAVVTICTTSLTFNNSTFCPHSVFMCFVWISEHTAIISPYNINWLVFITDTHVVCLLRGTDWAFICNSG